MSKKKYKPEYFVVSQMYWFKTLTRFNIPWLGWADKRDFFVYEIKQPFQIDPLSPLMFIAAHEPEDYVTMLEFFSLQHQRNIFIMTEHCAYLKMMAGHYERNLTSDNTQEK